VGYAPAGVNPGSSDAELVQRLRRREPGAFEAIYREHRDRIWQFLYRLSGRKETTEDLFQETWLAAARNAHRLRDGTRILPWLYTIARNKHRNGVRFGLFDEQRRARAGVAPAPEPPAPEAQIDARRSMEGFAEAFARLPEVHREVLLLHFVEGLDTAGVARVLGLREDAVRKRLSRARAQLSGLVSELEAGGAQ
jgi:RNA polymerase sigma-70 factor, ECF subfamily